MKLIYSFVLILFVFAANAQEGYEVRGKILDFHDKTPLSQAIIKIGELSAKSDAEGRFSFSDIPAGQYKLVAKHPDCNDYTENVKVTKDVFLNILLEHHIYEIQSVTLHTLHKAKGSMIVSTLAKADISKNSTENLGNILSNISGVSSLKTGNNITKPIIRGLYGSRIIILNNGVKMAEQEWGVEHAPNVDINTFDHIDVVKGASALKYGNDGVGGVVILEPLAIPKKDTLIGSLRFSGISNGRGGEMGANVLKSWDNQWFVKVDGSYQKIGDQYVPHHTLQNTGMAFNSFGFSFGKRSFLQGFDVSYNGITQDFGIYKGAHLASPEDFYNAINFGQAFYQDNFGYKIDNPKQNVSHHIAKLSAYKRFADFGKLTFQYSFQVNHRKEYDIRRGDLVNVPSMDLRLITNTASLVHLLERSTWSIESGISAGYQDNYPNPNTKARRLIPDYYRYDAGIFSVFKTKLASNLNAEVGLRYDYSRYDSYKYYDSDKWKASYASIYPNFFVKESGSRTLTRPVLDYHNMSANIGLDYKPSQKLEFKLNLSRADRTPNPAELFADGLHHSAAIMEEGNLTIKKETVYNINLSFIGKADVLKGLRIEANPYLMYSGSFVNQIPSSVISTNRGIFPVWTYQQIKARMLGIDVDAKLDVLENLKWKSSFGILKGDDLTSDEPLILMMPATLKNSIELMLDKPKDFYITLENQNVFKQNRFPIRDLPVSFIKDGTEYHEVVDFSSTPAAYTLFNASVGATIFKNLNINFRVNNIFNKEYREYLNRLRYYMPESGRNFVLTLRYNF